jgi:hypothetical protein
VKASYQIWEAGDTTVWYGGNQNCYTSPDIMPKHRQSRPARTTPIQLPLFAEEASLIRVRPDRNEFRYHRMAVWPDLFGRALFARHWDRLGTQGRIRLDPHPDPAPPSTLSPGSPTASATAAIRTARREPSVEKPAHGYPQNWG